MTSDGPLAFLNRLVGTWTTEATHPMIPGAVVHGTVIIEWLEGERFLIHRARTDHPDFPDSISIIGMTESDRVDSSTHTVPAGDGALHMHYFDSRGVFRDMNVSIDDSTWRIWRDAPEFSQRFTGTVTDEGRTIVGHWQLRKDDLHWHDDLEITYRKA